MCGLFRPIVFVIAPAILLATVRFGIIGATAATLLVAIIASVFVVEGIGQPIIAYAAQIMAADLRPAGLPRHHLVLVTANGRIADGAR